VSCRFHYAITREQADGRQILLVKGFTAHACVNRQGKLTPFPAVVMEKLTALLGKGTEPELKG
jgi:acyl-CoA thioester hydrolase